MKLLICSLALFLCTVATAGDWSKNNTILESSWQGINLIDWGQTLDIADKCRTSGIHERNPLLPRCPTFKQVNRHFLLGAALHLGVSYGLPQKYRSGFQWVTIGYGVNIIDSNFHLGLKVKF